jgi:hypothetical protein
MTDLKYGDRGPRVKQLQKLLNDNPYRHAKPLDVDGDFGPLTAAAVQRTKFWMGYKEENIEPVAGEMLFNLLSGSSKLSPEMLARRAARQRLSRPDPTKALQARILKSAKQDIGLLETTKNGVHNIIKYNDWWTDHLLDGDLGDGGAYCVRAGSFWAWEAGFHKCVWENTDVLLEDAKHGRNRVHLFDEPYPGCGFVIDFSGHSDPDHYGVFVKDNGDGTFTSLEANATLPSGKQGVGYHKRPYAQCWFIEREA